MRIVLFGRALIVRRFVTGPRVAFLVLLPLVVHAGWDFAESWRLRHLVADISGRGEPVSFMARTIDLSGDAGRAERLLRAAAVLSRDGDDVIQRDGLYRRIEAAAHNGRWPASLVAQMRQHVEIHRDALDLVDRVAPLPFAGFAPGAKYNALTADLVALSRLAAIRTRIASLDGNRSSAVASLLSELRLLRVFEHPWVLDISWPLSSVAAVLNQSDDDPASLTRLDVLLRDFDRDDLVKEQFIHERAAIVDVTTRPVTRGPLTATLVPSLDSWLLRPVVLHTMNHRVEDLTTMIATANEPWPRPLGALTEPFARSSQIDLVLHQADLFKLDAMARLVAGVRCARAAIAVARFRLERRTLPTALADIVPTYLDRMPIDPFSGDPLRYVLEGGGYSVKSWGSTRRDRSGQLRPLGIDVQPQ
jgi:hypothetical protein